MDNDFVSIVLTTIIIILVDIGATSFTGSLENPNERKNSYPHSGDSISTQW